MPAKIRVGVIFGGRSAEHQVSLVSAGSVIKALDKTKYEIIPIGITPEGKWLSSPEAIGNGVSVLALTLAELAGKK